jgi:hypothetical protein
MQFCRKASDLEWSDRVSPDVAHVGGVPIEALDLSHPCSVYTIVVYTVNAASRAANAPRDNPALTVLGSVFGK